MKNYKFTVISFVKLSTLAKLAISQDYVCLQYLGVLVPHVYHKPDSLENNCLQYFYCRVCAVMENLEK